MITALIKAIYWFSELLTTALLIRCILSWFARTPDSMVGRLYVLTIKFTEPFVEPCRRALSRLNTGMFDFSILLAMLVVQAVAGILVRLLIIFA